MNVILEKGAYLHWRMPTPAEISWQAWIGVARGCRGVIFFVLLPPANDWTPSKPTPEKWRKKIMANIKAHLPVKTRRFDSGKCALLNFDATPTDQMRALSETFATFAEFNDVLAKVKPSKTPEVFTESEATVSTLLAPEDGSIYCVVVNDKLQQEQKIDLLFTPDVERVVDMRSGAPLRLESVSETGLTAGTISLLPGAGTLLEVIRKKGMRSAILFEEDFSIQTLGVKLTNAVRTPIAGGWGTGFNWSVRKSASAPVDEYGIVTLKNLMKLSPPSMKPTFTGLSAGAKVDSYLLLNAKAETMETLVVVGKRGNNKEQWLKTGRYKIPLKIPKGTTELKLRLSEAAVLEKITILGVTAPSFPEGEKNERQKNTHNIAGAPGSRMDVVVARGMVRGVEQYNQRRQVDGETPGADVLLLECGGLQMAGGERSGVVRKSPLFGG
jgi:hypothetical protein